GPSDPYPAIINVSGVPGGAILKSISINSFGHTFPTDVDVLLQSPTGVNVIIMSDAFSSTSVSGINLVIQDGSPAMPTTAMVSGTYAPTNAGATDAFVAPGPGRLTQATPLLSDFGNGN